MQRQWLMGMIVFIFVSMLVLIFWPQDETHPLETYGLKTDDVRVLIDQLENQEQADAIQASITHQEVIVYANNQTYNIALPEDMFYISFAPYIQNTHPCYTHSLTGCQGELVNQMIDIDIYDDTGNLLESKQLSTGQDGFIGLYLNKGQSYRLEVSMNGLQASFTTRPDQTCYTEVKLT